MARYRPAVGGFQRESGGQPLFDRARQPMDVELERLHETPIRRVVRVLTRSGALLVAPEEKAAQPYLDFDQSKDDNGPKADVEVILAVPKFCRNQCSPVMPGHTFESTGVSR